MSEVKDLENEALPRVSCLARLRYPLKRGLG